MTEQSVQIKAVVIHRFFYNLKNQMIVISLFDGKACGLESLKRSNIPATHYFASEIDKWAMQVASKNHPEIIHIGDVRFVTISEKGFEYNGEFFIPDLILAGSPCFTSDSYVMTKTGYKFISDIKIGDLVLTHKGRFKKVLKTGMSIKPIWIVKGMGNPEIKTTEEHPFYVREMYRKHNPETRNSERKFRFPEWKKVKDLTRNDYAGIVISNEIRSTIKNEIFWYMIGRYTGDGWYRKTKRKHRKNSYLYQFIICCGHHEFDELYSKFKQFGEPFNYSKERTGYKFRICSKSLVEFVHPIGFKAHNKKIHPSLLSESSENINSFIEGLIDSDGTFHKKQKEYRIVSTSQELILGLQFLVTQIKNLKTGIHFTKKRNKTTIEGREVNQRDYWTLSWKPDVRKQDQGFFDEGYSWLPIRKIINTNKLDFVYNIQVEDDNSYTVNNFVVHNCQGFSNAGKGLNFEDPRSKLFFEFVRILNEAKVCNPNVKFLLENVDMKQEWADIISKHVGINPVVINSALVCAQNRVRMYWKNFGTIKDMFGNEISVIDQPKDRCIVLSHILQDESEVSEKYYLSEAMVARIKTKSPDNKAGTLTGGGHSGGLHSDMDGIVVHSSHTRTAGKNRKKKGGTGPLSRNDGKTYSLDTNPSNNRIERVGGVINYSEFKANKANKANNIDANYHKGHDNHGARTVIQINEANEFGKQPRQQNRVYDTKGRITGRNPDNPKSRQSGLDTEQMLEPRLDFKSGSLTTVQKDNVVIYDTRIRRLTEIECERLQGLKDNYTSGVSSTQRYKMIGNGWNIETIVHLLKQLNS